MGVANRPTFYFWEPSIVIAPVVALVLIFLGLAIRNLETRRLLVTGMRQWLATLA